MPIKRKERIDGIECYAKPSHQSDLLDMMVCKFHIEGVGWEEHGDWYEKKQRGIKELTIPLDSSMLLGRIHIPKEGIQIDPPTTPKGVIDETLPVSERIYEAFKRWKTRMYCEFEVAPHNNEVIHCRLEEEK